MKKNKFHISHFLNLRAFCAYCFFLFMVLIFFFITNPLVSLDTNAVPERIILNLTANPSQEMAVTWRTGPGIKHSRVEYMKATPKSTRSFNADSPDPYRNVKTMNAISEKVRIDKDIFVLHHSVILKGLESDTLYQYRVGDGKTWSEWCHFRTACKGDEPFQFIYLGDPQNDIKSFCSRTFRSAYSAAPGSRFILVTGDLVDKPWQDDLWGELFFAAGWIARRIPFIMVPGNHEYHRRGLFSKSPENPDKLWRVHFTLPENGPVALVETAFYIDFQGVRLILLNGNRKYEEQVEWLESLLSNNKSKWTILVIHQPFYSTGRKRDNSRLRELFLPLIDRYPVDLVLQGHDHSYGRTYKLRNGKVVGDSEKGTVFVVSISGPKFYGLNEKYRHLMKKIGTDVQLFQVITVEKDILTFESRTVTGELYDSFELEHTATREGSQL